MAIAERLVDAFERIRDAVHPAIQGLSAEQLAVRLDPEANTIAWLVWHLTRIQDDHVAGAAGTEQVWTAEGWVGRFGLPFAPEATGYGHGPGDVDAVRATSDLLAGYYDATHRHTVDYVSRLADGDFERVVDDSWEPPVTLGVRLVSVIADDLEHVGQAAFVRGIVERSP
jgi:Protein of unknown function (DUF664)